MKKLYIAALSLLLFSCSEYKENSALERCATEIFVKKELYYENDTLYKNDDNYKSATFNYLATENKKKQIDQIISSHKNSYKDLWNNWYKENPQPEYISNSDTERRPKYLVDYKAWEIKRDSFQNSEIIKESLKVRVELESKRDEIVDERYQFLISQRNIAKAASKKKLSRMSLKKKRELNGFLDSFLNCENALKKTKKTFMLKYGN